MPEWRRLLESQRRRSSTVRLNGGGQRRAQGGSGGEGPRGGRRWDCQEEAVDEDVEGEGGEEGAGVLRGEEGDLDRHHRRRVEQQRGRHRHQNCTGSERMWGARRSRGELWGCAVSNAQAALHTGVEKDESRPKV